MCFYCKLGVSVEPIVRAYSHQEMTKVLYSNEESLLATLMLDRDAAVSLVVSLLETQRRQEEG